MKTGDATMSGTWDDDEEEEGEAPQKHESYAHYLGMSSTCAYEAAALHLAILVPGRRGW
jgi:hypothetical protein